MAWSKEVLESIVQQVGERAATDLEFRSLCLKDIHAAVLQETGVEVPASFKIGVLDQTVYNLSIVLPAIQLPDNELSESELESVAGGSKAGAEDFFNGVAGGVMSVACGQPINTYSSEETAGNIVGQIIGSPIRIIS